MGISVEKNVDMSMSIAISDMFLTAFTGNRQNHCAGFQMAHWLFISWLVIKMNLQCIGIYVRVFCGTANKIIYRKEKLAHHT